MNRRDTVATCTRVQQQSLTRIVRKHEQSPDSGKLGIPYQGCAPLGGMRICDIALHLLDFAGTAGFRIRSRLLRAKCSAVN